MSAIGNYVHYHKRNYLMYGTNRNKGTTDDFTSIFNKQEKLFNYQKELTEAQMLETQYNNLFYPEENQVDARLEKFKKSMQKVIQTKLNNEFGHLVAGRFNPETLSVDKTVLYSKMNNAIQETRKRLGKAKLSQQETAKSLLKQIELMYNILDQQEFKDISEAEIKIKSAKNNLIAIKNNLETQISKANGGTVYIDNDSQDILTLRNIIKQFNRVPLLYHQNRAVFEWLVPFIQLQSNTLAEDRLAEEMEDLANSSAGAIEVRTNFNKSKSLINVNINYENVEITARGSKNDANIVVKWDDQGIDKEDSIQTRNIVKLNNIQLFNKESLYQLLVLSNQYNFANHYLNIVTSAGAETSDSSDIQEANTLLKSRILSTIANNFNLNTYNTKFLIINNYTQRKINVYSIPVLLAMISENLSNGDKKYSNIINLDSNFTIDNTWRDTVKERITGVILATRNTPISAILTPSMFNSYKNLVKNRRT